MKWWIGNMHKYHWDLKPGVEVDFSFQMLPVKFWKIALFVFAFKRQEKPSSWTITPSVVVVKQPVCIYIYIYVYVYIYIYTCIHSRNRLSICRILHTSCQLTPPRESAGNLFHTLHLPACSKIVRQQYKQMRHPGFYKGKFGHSGSFLMGRNFTTLGIGHFSHWSFLAPLHLRPWNSHPQLRRRFYICRLLKASWPVLAYKNRTCSETNWTVLPFSIY